MDRLSDILSQAHAFPSSPAGSEKNELKNEERPNHAEKTPTSASKDALRVLIVNIKKDLDQVLRILEETPLSENEIKTLTLSGSSGYEQVIEGVFNGIKMISEDGNAYDIPPNYASKSKLVEGDMMKLTINNQGKFVYKQIGPIERQRIRGTLFYNTLESQWTLIMATGKSYKILTASVTFYKGKAGDEVIALVPQSGHSDWAAVENIISRGA